MWAQLLDNQLDAHELREGPGLPLRRLVRACLVLACLVLGLPARSSQLSGWRHWPRPSARSIRGSPPQIGGFRRESEGPTVSLQFERSGIEFDLISFCSKHFKNDGLVWARWGASHGLEAPPVGEASLKGVILAAFDPRRTDSPGRQRWLRMRGSPPFLVGFLGGTRSSGDAIELRWVVGTDDCKCPRRK